MKTDKASKQRRNSIKETAGRVETRVVACAVIGIIGGMLLSIAIAF
jgi:hypothetical protein